MKKATEIGGRNIIHIMLHYISLLDIANAILHIVLYHNTDGL